jgi:hypothetical protein
MIFIKFLKNLIRPELAKPLVIKKNKQYSSNRFYTFGKKNKKKFFYIIKRKFSPTGLFSNVLFVLDHMQLAEKKKLIPIVDMFNYPTVYNEKKKINGSFNSWSYYFDTRHKYRLKDIYSSKNVSFSSNERLKKTLMFKDKDLEIIFFKNFKIKKNILKKVDYLKKKYFSNNERILGVHVRGTLQKVVKNHSFPPLTKDILNEANNIFINEKCTKIFLVSEDLAYIESFRKKFKNKVIILERPRSKPNIFSFHNNHFSVYKRKLHRFKLGEETIIDTLLLSKCNIFLFTDSNVRSAVMSFSKKKQIRYEIKTQKNSKYIFLARWLWYLKYYLPIFFGNISYKLIKKK